MKSRARASQSIVANRAPEKRSASFARGRGLLRRLRDHASTLLEQIAAQHDALGGRQLQLTVWALGYSGFARQAARLLQKSQRTTGAV